MAQKCTEKNLKKPKIEFATNARITTANYQPPTFLPVIYHLTSIIFSSGHKDAKTQRSTKAEFATNARITTANY